MHWLQLKTPQLPANTVSGKFQKTAKNYYLKKMQFRPVFLDFFRNGILQRAVFFALHSLHKTLLLIYLIQQSKTKIFLSTELQMDQESRWYSMFTRLYPNFMKIRISLAFFLVLTIFGLGRRCGCCCLPW